MYGIYIHIPFCRTACHYCDFHFSTNLRTMKAMGEALIKELNWKMEQSPGAVSTLYFGGGTPSLFDLDALKILVDRCVSSGSQPSEITLEANPEDITHERLQAWLAMGINRLSIGVQTFDDDRLRWMNRAHTGQQAIEAIVAAHDAGFNHLSADLIYGLPDRKVPFSEDLQKACDLPVDHLSAYILTVEDKTVLGRNVQKGIDRVAPDSLVESEYAELCARATQAGFEHYEVSNFARPGGRAQHNQHYWTGLPYLGIGPGAHGFDGKRRSANASNNPAYIAQISKAKKLTEIQADFESLTERDRYNEHLMTGLRTANGIDIAELTRKFGHNPIAEDPQFWKQCLDDCTIVALSDDNYRIREDKWLIADRISSAFFAVD
ncbi:MAG: radical SAM family heme chaperone HemW [Crocinitomicaceae bacterium]|nr:radical SAM family heme chaperone HemW [Crocinitomicaceae bacterium]